MSKFTTEHEILIRDTKGEVKAVRIAEYPELKGWCLIEQGVNAVVLERDQAYLVAEAIIKICDELGEKE